MFSRSLVVSVEFSLLFFHSNDEVLAHEHSRARLVEALFRRTPSPSEIEGALHLINHRLAMADPDSTRYRDLLLLLCGLAERLKTTDLDESDELDIWLIQMETLRLHPHEVLLPMVLDGVLYPTPLSSFIYLFTSSSSPRSPGSTELDRTREFQGRFGCLGESMGSTTAAGSRWHEREPGARLLCVSFRDAYHVYSLPQP